MKDLISVIVPVYNVETYIERCINSIIAQTYDRIEILLIDDGSTDKCGLLCDNYANTDDRIKVFHKENGGLSDARNYGIDRCSGNYITFVDSDDYIAANYIDLLYRSLIDESADISICASQYSFDNNYEQGIVSEGIHHNYSSYEAIIETLNLRLPQRAWGKLYKRELFNSIRFPVGKIYEDLAVVYDLLLLSNTVAYSNAPAYYYLIRSGSIMQSQFDIKQAIEIDLVDESMDKLELAYPELKRLINARRIYSYFVVLRRILLSNNPDEYLELRRDIKNRINNNSKGLIFDLNVKKSIKIKLLSYKFGENTYMAFQRIADKRNPEVV